MSSTLLRSKFVTFQEFVTSCIRRSTADMVCNSFHYVFEDVFRIQARFPCVKWRRMSKEKPPLHLTRGQDAWADIASDTFPQLSWLRRPMSLDALLAVCL